MNALIEKEQVAELLKVGNVKSNLLAGLLMNLLSINKINHLYSQSHTLDAISFVDYLLEQFGVTVEFDPNEIKNIPAERPFIAVANHPYGGIEGLILIKLLLTARPDCKVMTNFLLKKLDPIMEHVIPVNPFEDKKLYGNISGMKESLETIRNGGGIGIFPAGEVSSFQASHRRITDKEWQPGILKFIKKVEVPVVPIYFQGKNSVLFQLLGLIHPNLRTAKLPSEMFNKKNKTIKIRIGKPISPKEQKTFKSHGQLGRFIRARTYSLGSPLEVTKFYKPSLKALKRPKPIIEAIDQQILESEIDSIRSSCCIHTQKEFELYIASSDQIPNILNEIGRLREVTFRKIGEGSNRPIDLDEFDLYYNHLFIWDKENKQLVGAYRLGKGKEIIESFGKKGFYIQTLFRLKKPMNPILKRSVELGRSFIREEYQKKVLPLFLLWKGILYFLITNPEYRYLIGPVSISNQFSKLSKGLIIEFIKKNYFRADLAQHVKPRKRFKPKWKNVDALALLENSGTDFKTLDKYVQDIEPEHFNIPVLLKKYMKQNARIIAFNVDPKFGHALDGLIILDLNDVPKETIQDLKKDFDLTEI